jgi:hypothetical protein
MQFLAEESFGGEIVPKTWPVFLLTPVYSPDRDLWRMQLEPRGIEFLLPALPSSVPHFNVEFEDFSLAR